MQYTGLICARGGSKGLPGKNCKELMGKSLIEHAVAKARAVSRISSVMVSTDCKKIAQLAQSEGAQIPFMRPAHLSQDDSAEWDVWKHMLEYLICEHITTDALVVVPPTAPLRSVQDIEACLDVFESSEVDMVITVTDASRSPYFNMVKTTDNGCVDLVIKPDNIVSRRQDVPVVYDMTTVAYVANADFVLSGKTMFDGRVGYVHIPPERAVDIDTQLDFDIAQCIAAQNG